MSIFCFGFHMRINLQLIYVTNLTYIINFFFIKFKFNYFYIHDMECFLVTNFSIVVQLCQNLFLKYQKRKTNQILVKNIKSNISKISKRKTL